MPHENARLQGSFTRRLAALMALGFAALLAAGIATAWLQSQNVKNARWVEHTLDVQARVGEFTSANERVETARRGALLSGGVFREYMERADAEAAERLDALERLTIDNDVQRTRIAELRRLLAEQRVYQRQTAGFTGVGRTQLLDGFDRDRGVLLIRRVREVANSVLSEERRLLEEREVVQARTLRTFYAILALAGALVVLVAATTMIVILRYTRELTASRIELRRLNGDLEVLVQERTSELQRANAEIQRFAYIVSHDLRSPLVNVMGFTAELDAARKAVAAHIDQLEQSHPGLVEAPVREAVQQELPEAIGFIRSSTQKMDRLINAILRLSREGRRALMPERIDANQLVQGIIDTVQHRITDAGAEVKARPLPEITTDRLAFEQILSNLIENALKYLQPGRPGIITISGKTEHDRAIFDVTDNGRGIDPRDHERIFDLFRRSGTQDQPGEGIGLAHVRALAYRLGGLIEVRSELDRGSTFRLSLPRVLNAGDLKND